MAIKLYVYLNFMDTKIVYFRDKVNYKKCIEAIKSGEVVVFPTETVYGIGVNALDKNGVKKIYNIKKRETDNPLIVHICDYNIDKYGKNIKPYVYDLIKEFWPGPFTIILNKKDIIPYEVTGGRDTVALRMPNHHVALNLIKESSVPIAAPSANISGRPSGTNAKRCFEDLKGLVNFIIDGEESLIGLESTVVDCTGDTPILVRPGFITLHDIKKVINNAKIYEGINKRFINESPISPGLKYKHYAPKGNMVILKGDKNKVYDYIKLKSISHKNIGVLCVNENRDFYEEIKNSLSIDLTIVNIGHRDDENEIGRNLFECIRKFDDADSDFIISECFYDDFSNAIMNRLLKASSYNIINL